MQVREHPEKGIFVMGLSTYVVKGAQDLMKVLKKGQKSRKGTCARRLHFPSLLPNNACAVGATAMNAGSSRSHSILTITVETRCQCARVPASSVTQPICSEAGPTGDVHYRVGKLNLVDLAGSERQKKTESSGAHSPARTGNVVTPLTPECRVCRPAA
jgi:hypothetical protein